MNQPIAPATSALSAFLRDLPENLQQPASMALVGSVGAHVFFFASLPAFTSPPAPPDLREVRLVNLTPQELSRLPQAPIASPFGLPPIPKSDAKFNLPLGQPFPQPPTDFQPYKIPDLSIKTPPIVVSPPPIQPFDISPYLYQFRPPAPAPSPAEAPEIVNPPASNSPSQTTPDNSPSRLFPPDNRSGATSSSIPNLSPAAPIVPSPPVASPTDPPSPNSPPPATPEEPARPIDRLLAANRELRVLYARENFVFNPMGGTPQEWGEKTTQNFQDWFKQNITDKNISDDNLAEQAIEREISYSSPVPLTQKYDPALVYVLVDPEGKVAANPAVLGRTGYRYLDILAERSIAQIIADLKPTGKYVICKIKLTFKPEMQPPSPPAS
ncbi:MAG: hypothetical protein HC780_16250 [Leptolyngbyaceae cyanobacterium CSU_1_3]|nr:hypothetical protein [Leptolyngbyaceae cyanobacterium CSU_1_3]